MDLHTLAQLHLTFANVSLMVLCCVLAVGCAAGARWIRPTALGWVARIGLYILGAAFVAGAYLALP
jgi:hypothetical protein